MHTKHHHIASAEARHRASHLRKESSDGRDTSELIRTIYVNGTMGSVRCVHKLLVYAIIVDRESGEVVVHVLYNVVWPVDDGTSPGSKITGRMGTCALQVEGLRI